MNTRKVLRIIVVLQAVLLLGLVAMFGLVPGLGSRGARADSVQHFSLLAETMQPVDSTIEYDSYDAYLETTQDSSLNTTAYIGQVTLPDGANIVGVRCFGEDDDPNPDAEFSFALFRYSLVANFEAVTEWVSSDNQGKQQVQAPVLSDPHLIAAVDNAAYSYGIYLTLPEPVAGTLRVLRCVVDTSYSVQLPFINRDMIN
jgi:hypothetical protein